MAIYTILKDRAPYYRLQINFNGDLFVQEVYSEEVGEILSSLFQEYADSYEYDYHNDPDILVVLSARSQDGN